MIRRFASKRQQSLTVGFLRRAILLCLNEIEDPSQVYTWYVVCPQPIPFYLSNEANTLAPPPLLPPPNPQPIDLFRFVVSARKTSVQVSSSTTTTYFNGHLLSIPIQVSMHAFQRHLCCVIVNEWYVNKWSFYAPWKLFTETNDKCYYPVQSYK